MAKRKPSKRTTVRKVQATENLPPPEAIPDVPVKPEVDEEPWGDDGLTTRQRLFVEALVGPAGGVASKAAEIAGYRSDNINSLRATASRVLTYVNVQQAIAHAFARLKDSPEWARASLVELANASMAQFVTVDEKGETTLDFKKAAEAGALGAIREYREEVIKGGETVQVIKRTVKLHDRRAALETLLRLQGKLVDPHIVTGNVQHTHTLSPVMEKVLADPEAFKAARILASRLRSAEPSGSNGNGNGNGHNGH